MASESRPRRLRRAMAPEEVGDEAFLKVRGPSKADLLNG